MISENPSLQEILSVIKNGIDVGEFIVSGLTGLTPEILGQAIREWQDPLMIVEWLKLENPFISVVAKSLFRSNWERVEYVLIDGDFLYREIAKDKEKKTLLDTQRGMAWLNYVRRRSYEYYFFYTWGKKCPRCAKNMERKKTKGVSNVADEIYLCKCGYIIPIIDAGSTYYENQGHNRSTLQLSAPTKLEV
jgi:hypothetical protein